MFILNYLFYFLIFFKNKKLICFSLDENKLRDIRIFKASEDNVWKSLEIAINNMANLTSQLTYVPTNLLPHKDGNSLKDCYLDKNSITSFQSDGYIVLDNILPEPLLTKVLLRITNKSKDLFISSTNFNKQKNIISFVRFINNFYYIFIVFFF